MFITIKETQMFVVFDFDGTLCDISHRLPLITDKKKRDYRTFYKKCVDDSPKWETIKVLYALRNFGHKIEIWSGRSEEVRQESEDWLVRHGIDPRYLTRMRPINNHIPDTRLKEEWLLSLDGDKPELIFEDRQRVVDMWRSHGISCFQVDKWDEKK